MDSINTSLSSASQKGSSSGEFNANGKCSKKALIAACVTAAVVIIGLVIGLILALTRKTSPKCKYGGKYTDGECVCPADSTTLVEGDCVCKEGYEASADDSTCEPKPADRKCKFGGTVNQE